MSLLAALYLDFDEKHHLRKNLPCGMERNFQLIHSTCRDMEIRYSAVRVVGRFTAKLTIVALIQAESRHLHEREASVQKSFTRLWT